jgi:hypothetical protein
VPLIVTAALLAPSSTGPGAQVQELLELEALAQHRPIDEDEQI